MKITRTVGVQGATIFALSDAVNAEFDVVAADGEAVIDVRVQAVAASDSDGIADWYTALLLIGEAS